MEVSAVAFEWKDLAEDFSDRQRAIVGEAFYDEVVRTMSQWEDLGDALEVACGDGGFTSLFVSKARHLVATDLEEAMCRVARERLSTWPHAEVRQADLFDLPFGEKSFDTVLALNILHVLPNRTGALREMRRMLREGGRLLLMDFGTDGMSFDEIMAMAGRYQRAFGPVEDRKQPVSFDQLAEEIETSGFEILNQERLCSPTGAALVLEARRKETD